MTNAAVSSFTLFGIKIPSLYLKQRAIKKLTQKYDWPLKFQKQLQKRSICHLILLTKLNYFWKLLKKILYLWTFLPLSGAFPSMYGETWMISNEKWSLLRTETSYSLNLTFVHIFLRKNLYQRLWNDFNDLHITLLHSMSKITRFCFENNILW